MRFSFEIRELIKLKTGKELISPSDCEYIALDIFSKTNEHIGVNTIKRLLGFIDDDRNPRISTLNIIAKYLGYFDWEMLSKANVFNSTFDEIEGELDITNLRIGQRLELSYLPNRIVKIEYKGNYIFEVVNSINSKLQIGDTFDMRYLILNYPLVASNVTRNGKILGQLKAGQISGITSIKILKE